jgi:predicted acetyltransferase|tara:strand:+ start:1759 stop:2796 length:1038 start_codon:yes stop_codon:yes gene_type:complete
MQKIKKYIGIAENKKDILSASSLVKKIFFDGDFNNQFLFPKESLKRENIVVIKYNESLVATCFIHNRIFYFKGDKIEASFLSYICVDINRRGQGISKNLINKAIELCEKRNKTVSFVIARKKADFFYNKFSFFGFSSYPTITIKSLPKTSTNDNFSFEEIDTAYLPIVEKIYDNIYKFLPGSFYRDQKDWQFIFKKSKLLNVFLKAILDEENTIVGYIAYKENQIIEFALKEGVNYSNIIISFNKNNGFDSLTFNLGINHPITPFLKDYDITYTIRKCWYGGHMMRINNEKYFLDKLDKIDNNKYLQLEESDSKKIQFDFLLENKLYDLPPSSNIIYNIPFMDQI